MANDIQQDIRNHVHLLLPTYFDNNQAFKRYDQIDSQYYTTISAIKKVVMISHIWETAAEPDLTDQQFAWVKQYVNQLEDTHCAVFYDYSSIPQKGKTEKERDGTLIPQLTQLPDLSKEMRTIQQNILKGMNDLYGGQFSECSASFTTLNICPTDLYQVRTWPYYEVFISSIHGTLNKEFGRAKLPLLTLCDNLAKGTLDAKALIELRDQRVYNSRSFAEGITKLQVKLCDAHLGEVIQTFSKVQKLSLLYDPTLTLSLDRTLDVVTILRDLLSELLSAGIVYSLLSTSVTDLSDRSTIIQSLHENERAHYAAYKKTSKLGDEWELEE